VATLLPQVASGEAQAAAAQQLAQLWNKKDPHAYQAWVASLPEGALKTAARSPY
jgi:copper(I)-binding protein